MHMMVYKFYSHPVIGLETNTPQTWAKKSQNIHRLHQWSYDIYLLSLPGLSYFVFINSFTCCVCIWLRKAPNIHHHCCFVSSLLSCCHLDIRFIFHSFGPEKPFFCFVSNCTFAITSSVCTRVSMDKWLLHFCERSPCGYSRLSICKQPPSKPLLLCAVSIY